MRSKLLKRKKEKKEGILYSTLLEIPLNNNEKYVEKKKTTKSINHTQFSIMLYKYTYIYLMVYNI